jgi:hypothetical protein
MHVFGLRLSRKCFLKPDCRILFLFTDKRMCVEQKNAPKSFYKKRATPNISKWLKLWLVFMGASAIHYYLERSLPLFGTNQ